jgi:hypothetical protein
MPNAPAGPAPGPALKGADGKPLGPQYVNSVVSGETKTPQQLQKEFQSNRFSKAATIKEGFKNDGKGEEAPVETEATSTEDTTEVVAAEPDVAEAVTAEKPDGELVGKDVTTDADVEKARLARVEEAGKRARADIRRHRARQAELASARAQVASQASTLADLEAKAKRGADLERALRADPLKAIEQLGVTPEQIAQRVLLANTPEEKIAALTAQIETERKERLRMEEAIKSEKAAAQRAADNARVEKEFIRLGTNVEKYPHLKGHPPEALLALGKQVAMKAQEKYRSMGVSAPTITDRQILSYLNELYAPKADAAPAATSKAATATSSKAVAKPAGKASPKPESPRTLTSGQTAGSFTRPINLDKLSRNERIKLLQQDLRRNS